MPDIYQDLNQLLTCLYTAPGEGQNWQRFLSTFADLTDSAQSLMFFHDERQQRTHINCGHNLDDAFEQSYDAYYQHLNPYLKSADLLFPLAGTYGLLSEHLADKDVMKTEFFNDFVLPQGLTVVNGVRLTPLMSDGVMTAMSLHRGVEAPGDPTHALQLCDLLMPHLQTAMRLQARIAELESGMSTMASLFDRVPFGMVLFNGRGQCLLVNDEAQAIFNAVDGITLRNGKISTALDTQSGVIAKMINQARLVGQGETIDPIGVCRVLRPSGKRSYELMVAPVFEKDSDSVLNNTSVAVFIFDPETESESLETLMARMYQLTSKEVEVLMLLLQGYNATQVSDQLGKSRETVKNQLRSIFRKTDTYRQSELISVVLKGVGMVRGPLS